LLERKQERYYQQVLVDGHWVNVYMKSLSKGDILFLIGSMTAKELGTIYRSRWSIEVLLQSMKKRGFDLESTHLRCRKKIKKLVALVAIAFAFSLLAGRQYDQKVKKIKTKKNGYKANSFFRKGLDLLKDYLNNKPIADEQFWDQALDRFYHWIRIRLVYFKT
jgi:Transposase DDE domain